MLALIAGMGGLPGAVLARLGGEAVLVCEIEGFPADLPEDVPRLRFRVERLAAFLAHLKVRGVTRVCMAGAIRRPRLRLAAIGLSTWPLVPRVLRAIRKGDDGLLREVVAIFEERGLAVVGAAELAPDLLPAAGVTTQAWPAVVHRADAQAGEKVVAAMGESDSGQACVLAAGRVVAREGRAGTDAMLRALGPRLLPPRAGATEAEGLVWPLNIAGQMVAEAADWLAGVPADGLPAAGGLLFKAPKPGQERRVDLPVIGPGTVEGARRAGLAGIVIEAGGVMVLDLAGVVAACDEAGLFLWVRPHGG
jgi:DUF1009 family protein